MTPNDADARRTNQLGVATDTWALGLLLHLLCYLRLCVRAPSRRTDPSRPWTHDDVDPLRAEILAYGGFDALRPAIARHDLPRILLELMADLLSISPSRRPKASTVLNRLRSREPELSAEAGAAALVPVRSRADSGATIKDVVPAATVSMAPRPSLDRLAVSLFVVLKSISFAATLGPHASQLTLAVGLIEVSMCVGRLCGLR